MQEKRYTSGDANALKLESDIQERGLNAPRVTLFRIQEVIGCMNTFRVSDALEALGQPHNEGHACLTICVITLKNGFVVTGQSACASPANFDAEIGARIARQNAEAKIWELEGYLLREDIFRKDR